MHSWWFASWRFLVISALGGIVFLVAAGQRAARAGGPIGVGGPAFNPGVEGQFLVWDTSAEIEYHTDGGNLGQLDNMTANTEVEGMFQVWEDVTTATIGFNRPAGAAGQLTNPGFDGDISELSEYNTFNCDPATRDQNPIIYDEDGTLFSALNFPTGVIGFAGPCAFNFSGFITSARAALNGKFHDGIPDTDMDGRNDELSLTSFRAVFIHEFGHFAGLDHSQVNVVCAFFCSDPDDQEGLPTMFPFLVGNFMATLAPDDIAWISNLYPTANFNNSFGMITGTIRFSDGMTHAQGVNVVARQVDDPGTPGIDESRRNAVSVVSGFRFTGNPGQSVTGTNDPGVLDPFGSRDPTVIGTYEIPVTSENYTVEVESIFCNALVEGECFFAGSGVGPLNPPIPNPGPPEFWDINESATDVLTDSDPVPVMCMPACSTAAGFDIILNGTDPRFDGFESRLWWREPAPAWIRRVIPALDRAAG